MSANRSDYQSFSADDLIQTYRRLRKRSKVKSAEIVDLDEQLINGWSDLECLTLRLVELGNKLDRLQQRKKIPGADLKNEQDQLTVLTKAIAQLEEKNALYEKINEDLQGIKEKKEEKVKDYQDKEGQILKCRKADLEKMSQEELIVLIGKVEDLNARKNAEISGLESVIDLIDVKEDSLVKEIKDLNAKVKALKVAASSVSEEKNPRLTELEEAWYAANEINAHHQGQNRELAKIIALQDKRIFNFGGRLSVGLKENRQQKSSSSLSVVMHKNPHAFSLTLSKANEGGGDKKGEEDALSSSPIKPVIR